MVVMQKIYFKKILAASKKGANGHDLVRAEHRVLFALCYHTAARPASEPCRLRNGDIRFRRDDWAEVSYREKKNARGVRTLPLEPALAKELRAIMEPEPLAEDERNAWRQRPVFKKRGSERQMDCFSYRKAWRAAVSEVPEAEGMVLRDFRATARTRMTQARVPEAIIRRFMGHAATVSEGYYEPTFADLQEASLALSLESELAAGLAAGQAGS